MGAGTVGDSWAGYQALEMLEAFASVGVKYFDLTLIDLNGEKVRYHSGKSHKTLGQWIWPMLRDAQRDRLNIIIRPRSLGAELMQLDDLASVEVERVKPVSLLIVRTSPGNHQAWIAVGDGDKSLQSRLKKGVGGEWH